MAMFQTTFILLLLSITKQAVAHSASTLSISSVSNLILTAKVESQSLFCTTDSDCKDNGLCIDDKTKKYCSSGNTTCTCATPCDSPDDCYHTKCASGGDGNDFPLVCFTCGSNVLNVIPGHKCPTENCYETGCRKGTLCVERDFGQFTTCTALHNNCSCALECDGTGICNSVGAQCGIMNRNGIKSSSICFTCDSENVTVLEGQACGSPQPTATPSPPSMIGNHTDGDTPVALVVGIALSVISVIIIVLLLFICWRSNNSTDSTGEEPITHFYIFQKVHLFFKK